MFKTLNEKNYFETDFPNLEDITLKHRNENGIARKISAWSKESILNSKTLIFRNQNFHYLCLDCDKGFSKVNPIITNFLNDNNIVYFVTEGTWSKDKPQDSATIAIKFQNFDKEQHQKLNKLLKVVSRLENGEMSCDPLAIGYQMKSVFTHQMESYYVNMDGNVYDLKELTEIAYKYFDKKWNDVERLANQYYSESYYFKYEQMMSKPFEEIYFTKLEKYYQNMSKHNYDDIWFCSKDKEIEFEMIMNKYRELPTNDKIAIASERTLVKDYILAKWTKYCDYEYDLRWLRSQLVAKYGISESMIYWCAETHGISPLRTSTKYLNYVTLLETDKVNEIKNKLDEVRRKPRQRKFDKKRKPHKEHRNKGKGTSYLMEKNGQMKEVTSKRKSQYEKRGWNVIL